jgi:hypothetical protein
VQAPRYLLSQAHNPHTLDSLILQPALHNPRQPARQYILLLYEVCQSVPATHKSITHGVGWPYKQTAKHLAANAAPALPLHPGPGPGSEPFTFRACSHWCQQGPHICLCLATRGGLLPSLWLQRLLSQDPADRINQLSGRSAFLPWVWCTLTGSHTPTMPACRSSGTAKHHCQEGWLHAFGLAAFASGLLVWPYPKPLMLNPKHRNQGKPHTSRL